jgi:hypothetical protein
VDAENLVCGVEHLGRDVHGIAVVEGEIMESMERWATTLDDEARSLGENRVANQKQNSENGLVCVAQTFLCLEGTQQIERQNAECEFLQPPNELILGMDLVVLATEKVDEMPQEDEEQRRVREANTSFECLASHGSDSACRT